MFGREVCLFKDLLLQCVLYQGHLIWITSNNAAVNNIGGIFMELENRDSYSRLVVDEDYDGKYRLERVSLALIHYLCVCRYLIYFTSDSDV